MIFSVALYLKNSIFRQRIGNLEELQARIAEKINEINNTPDMLRNVFDGTKRGVRKYLEGGGGHFQHLLYLNKQSNNESVLFIPQNNYT